MYVDNSTEANVKIRSIHFSFLAGLKIKDVTTSIVPFGQMHMIQGTDS